MELRIDSQSIFLLPGFAVNWQKGRQAGWPRLHNPTHVLNWLMRHLATIAYVNMHVPCWFRIDHAQIGSPSPLTGLRLWQDPVMGGWPGIVHGCVLFSPCDHARLLVVLSIHYLIYCNYGCTLVMMNILKTRYGWDVPQKLVSFLAEILLPWSPFVNILFSSNICNN